MPSCMNFSWSLRPFRLPAILFLWVLKLEVLIGVPKLCQLACQPIFSVSTETMPVAHQTAYGRGCIVWRHGNRTLLLLSYPTIFRICFNNLVYLALFKHENGPFSPLTVGNILLFGTLTSSMLMSPVMDALKDSLPLILLATSPFIPFSRMNPLMSPFSSLAHTTKTSAIGEFVIHIFWPVRTYSFPSSLALHFIPPGSEPWSGSVKPKHPIS